MPASKQKYIMGERYWRLRSGVTKARAIELGAKERKAGYKARAEKMARGNYVVWTTRKWANL